VARRKRLGKVDIGNGAVHTTSKSAGEEAGNEN